MMFLCTSKFDMDEEQAVFLADSFSQDKIEAAKEEREEIRDQFDLDPISDNEEGAQKEER